MLANRAERNNFLAGMKAKPCLDCGNLFPWYCMDFDHVPDRGTKLFELNQNAIAKRTLEEVEAEMKKCDLVCSNCHRIRTHERRYTGWGGSKPQPVCGRGHDLTDPANQRIENGKRKGCLPCRRITDNERYHRTKEGE